MLCAGPRDALYTRGKPAPIATILRPLHLRSRSIHRRNRYGTAHLPNTPPLAPLPTSSSPTPLPTPRKRRTLSPTSPKRTLHAAVLPASPPTARIHTDTHAPPTTRTFVAQKNPLPLDDSRDAQYLAIARTPDPFSVGRLALQLPLQCTLHTSVEPQCHGVAVLCEIAVEDVEAVAVEAE